MDHLLKYLIILFCLFLLGGNALADGSKDLYPMGVKGNRAFLISREDYAGNNNFPFPTLGTHYVYLKEGETLATASSATYIGNGGIRLTKPNGLTIFRNSSNSSSNSSVGKIMSKNGVGTREAELRGPRIGYDAWEINVAAGEEGVWKVEFIPPNGTTLNNFSEAVPRVFADADWQQADSYYISAWDVSVRNSSDTDWISGRVYTNVLSLYISSALSNPNEAFYGVNYVLTKDGYVYRVDANGSNGIAFSYFVNNKGFIDLSGQPIYKSVNNMNLIMNGGVHDPRREDTDLLVTHKIMYTLPDMTMPRESSGRGVPGEKTWLVEPKKDAVISNMSIQGVEGESHFISRKGAFISFETNVKSSYQIKLKSNSSTHLFTERNIIVEAEEGANRFYWNGLDGDGKLVPLGELYDISLEIKVLGGEIHFPYMDMEINPNGILISRLNDHLDLNNPIDPIVYWDDSDIPLGLPSENPNLIVNLNGVLSSLDGHRWGTYSNQIGNVNNNQDYGAFSYGNNMAIDTWTYSLSLSESITPKITVRVSDLSIKSVETDKTEIELGEEITYRVTVLNDGPSDVESAKFSYNLPVGFTIQRISHENNCGRVVTSSYLGNSMQAKVNMEDQCEIVFVITAIANSSVEDKTYGYYITHADVLRPAGVTDPDATSNNIAELVPNSAKEECDNNGLGQSCNNIMIDNKVFLWEPLHERGKLSLIKEARHIDSNNNGYHEAGEVIEYTFTLHNTGQVIVSEIYFNDPMLAVTQGKFSDTPLLIGENVSITRSYVLTQTDITRGYVSNTANVLGKNPRGFDVKDISGLTVNDDIPTRIELFQPPRVSLKKTVSNKGTGESGQFTLGDRIEYKFEVQNEEGFPVSDAVIDDPLLNPSFIHIGDVSAKDITVVQRSYRVTENDIRNGQIENTAFLRFTDPRNNSQQNLRSINQFDMLAPTITILAKPPVAVDDQLRQYMGSQVSHHILSNDEKGSSSIVNSSIEIVSEPTQGKVIVKPNGEIVYIPNAGFYGEDNLTYRFQDASRLYSNDAFVQFTVDPTQAIAKQDKFEVDYNGAIDFDVLMNDYTIGGSTLVYSSLEFVDLPTKGYVVLSTDGTVRYRPDKNYTGVDYFTYRIQDSNGMWSEPGKVTLVSTGFSVPNVITPNGDGNNDTFIILGGYLFERIQLEIIDRFGQQIHVSENYRNDWGAEGISDGTYYYIIRGFRNGKQSLYKNGTITVIRQFFGN